MELSLGKVSINKTHFSIAYLLLKLHSFLINEHNTIVARITDHNQIVFQVLLLFNAENFARIPKILGSGSLFDL